MWEQRSSCKGERTRKGANHSIAGAAGIWPLSAIPIERHATPPEATGTARQHNSCYARCSSCGKHATPPSQSVTIRRSRQSRKSNQQVPSRVELRKNERGFSIHRQACRSGSRFTLRQGKSVLKSTGGFRLGRLARHILVCLSTVIRGRTEEGSHNKCTFQTGARASRWRAQLTGHPSTGGVHGRETVLGPHVPTCPKESTSN